MSSDGCLIILIIQPHSDDRDSTKRNHWKHPVLDQYYVISELERSARNCQHCTVLWKPDSLITQIFNVKFCDILSHGCRLCVFIKCEYVEGQGGLESYRKPYMNGNFIPSSQIAESYMRRALLLRTRHITSQIKSTITTQFVSQV